MIKQLFNFFFCLVLCLFPLSLLAQQTGKVQKRQNYEFYKNMPVYAEKLIADLGWDSGNCFFSYLLSDACSAHILSGAGGPFQIDAARFQEL